MLSSILTYLIDNISSLLIPVSLQSVLTFALSSSMFQLDECFRSVGHQTFQVQHALIQIPVIQLVNFYKKESLISYQYLHVMTTTFIPNLSDKLIKFLDANQDSYHSQHAYYLLTLGIHIYYKIYIIGSLSIAGQAQFRTKSSSLFSFIFPGKKPNDYLHNQIYTELDIFCITFVCACKRRASIFTRVFQERRRRE